MTIRIVRYLSADGRDLFQDWLDRLADHVGRKAVTRRLLRVAAGNLGDWKPCRDGVAELRIDVGPGYRVYFARTAREIVLLLCAGDKQSQDKDIERAVGLWRDWQRRRE
ncbi:MAG: type II toxin-antitoxin system RelE/ParE family toxin [Rhodospirillaceae bacterium]|nr:type II toxin-antitoxin system RelE/ParE family toxin [Rhodospirillaceae bacterium]